jgi:hypothetical protein
MSKALYHAFVVELHVLLTPGWSGRMTLVLALRCWAASMHSIRRVTLT